MRKNNIKVLTKKDQETLRAFANTHCINKKQLTENLGQNERRIQNFKKDGLIQEKMYFNNSTKSTEKYFVLTDRGKNMVEDKLHINNFYTSNSAQHDLALTDRYLELSQSERLTWVTEQEQQQRFDTTIGSPCDGAYTNSEGNLVFVEVITQNYSKEMRESKQEYAQNNSAEMESIRA